MTDWLAILPTTAARQAKAEIRRAKPASRLRGASMTEFIVVLPIMLLIGLGIIHYGLLFFAKNNFNYAAFQAARAGAMANADIATVTAAYRKALIPLYGGGRNPTELGAAYAKVLADTRPDTLKVELLNPTQEGFADWNAQALQDDPKLGNGRRVIPVLMQNYPQALQQLKMTRDPKSIGPNSGQNLADAALIKVRIVQGYEPKVPVIGRMLAYLGGFGETDPFRKALYAAGRIPVVSQVTMQMQSDAIETVNASSPGRGNDNHPGAPRPSPDPSPPSDPSDPNAPLPPCTGAFCAPEVENPPCNGATDPNCANVPQDPCPAALSAGAPARPASPSF